VNLDINNFAEQFRNLDPANIGNWPTLVKGVIILLVAVAVLAAGYYFDTQKQLEKLGRVERQEQGLKDEFEKKQAKAANLPAYKAQMQEMEDSFGTMLRQLPSKTEVADLLVDITQTGLASGLEFELFKPEGERPKEFYAELPISVKVLGSYHQLGEFVGGIAALPRIVTLHDIAVQSQQDGGLSMSAIAKTYRYLDEDELAAGSASKKKSRRR
jgi:type IV pilus assembly protein PilO